MATELLTVEDLGKMEDLAVRVNITKFQLCNAYATNAVALISNGITGYVQSRRAFGAYLSQITLNSTLGLLSALRQHGRPVYFHVRQVLEYTILACYALHHPDEAQYFSDDPTQIDHKKLMTDLVYHWIEQSYPTISETVHGFKKFIHKTELHASINHAFATLDGLSETGGNHRMNFLDKHDPISITTDLFHVGFSAHTAIHSIALANLDIGVVRVVCSFNQQKADLRK